MERLLNVLVEESMQVAQPALVAGGIAGKENVLPSGDSPMSDVTSPALCGAPVPRGVALVPRLSISIPLTSIPGANQTAISPTSVPNACGQISPRSYPCLWQGCNSNFTTRTGLATHASDHLKIHFKSESAKKQNLQVVCKWNGCSEWFDNVISLGKHLAEESHIGQTPYIPKEPTLSEKSEKKKHLCSQCGKNFSSSSNLKVHERLHDPNRKRHVCPMNPCTKSYSTEADLKIHLRSHRGEFAHKCTYPGCTLQFVRVSQLYAHERVHDNIAVLKCGLCGKRFRMKAELVHHEQTHLEADARMIMESFSFNTSSSTESINGMENMQISVDTVSTLACKEHL